MSKKKKQYLQKLIAKKQRLAQVAQGAVVSFSEKTEIEPHQQSSASEIEPYQKPAEAVVESTAYKPKTTLDRSLRKTAASIVVIAVLLVAAVIFDKKSPYLNQFGDWIYNALRLQG